MAIDEMCAFSKVHNTLLVCFELLPRRNLRHPEVLSYAFLLHIHQMHISHEVLWSS